VYVNRTAEELGYSVVKLWVSQKEEKDSKKTWMNVVVWFIQGGNFNSEEIGRRGKFIYCQYSRSGARFF